MSLIIRWKWDSSRPTLTEIAEMSKGDSGRVIIIYEEPSFLDRLKGFFHRFRR